MRNYNIYRQVGWQAHGILVGKIAVRNGTLEGKIAPELFPHRPALRREAECHAAGIFADMSVRISGTCYWISPTA